MSSALVPWKRSWRVIARRAAAVVSAVGGTCEVTSLDLLLGSGEGLAASLTAPAAEFCQRCGVRMTCIGCCTADIEQAYEKVSLMELVVV